MSQEDVESIYDGSRLLAMIVRSTFNQQGIHFFTKNELSQQLAFMRHPAGKTIQPHLHNPVPREVSYTQETLFIRKGSMRVDFYSDSKDFLTSRVLNRGDVILLICGGHGFEVIEEVEMLEVKQGPYAGEADKTRFHAKPRVIEHSSERELQPVL